MCTASREQLIQVVEYYMSELYDEVQRRVGERTQIGLTLLELATDQMALAKHSESKRRNLKP